MAEWPEVVMRRKFPGLPRAVHASEARIDCEYERYIPKTVLEEVERERDDHGSELSSLRGELATLLGPQRPKEGVTPNEQWIAAVSQVLIERDHLNAILDALVGDGAVEAMARVECERAASWGRHAVWDDLHPTTRESYLDSARTNLRAALAAAKKQVEGERGEPNGE